MIITNHKSRKDRFRQYNGQTGQTMIYKALYKQIKINKRNTLNTGRELRCSGRVYSCYKPSDMSRKRKGPDCDYDKRNILVSVVICDTYIIVTLSKS